MKKIICKNYAFTLVELIIVITILAILSTISFVSFQGYTRDSRDSTRLLSIKEIGKTLEILKTTSGIYPEIESQTGTGTIGGVVLSKVGVLGDNSSKILKINKTPTDPVSGNKYLYGLSYDNKYYQIAGTFENPNAGIMETSYADAGNFKAKVEGNYKGVIKYLSGTNTYVANLPSLIFLSGGTLDLINQEGYFVVNNGKNLPYLIDTKTTQYNQTSSGVLKDLTGTSTTLTGVLYNGGNLDLLSIKLGLNKDLLGYELIGNEYNKKISNGCPNGFIKVPGNSTFSTSDFCLAKYEMKQISGNDTYCPNGIQCGDADGIIEQTDFPLSNIIVSKPDGTSIHNIKQEAAIQACLNMGTGYHLITNNEWMTVSRNIEQQAINWSNNIVGSGFLYNGNVSGSNTYLPSGDDLSELLKTSTSPTLSNRRVLVLSNGEYLWDLSGNTWEHVNKGNTINGDGFMSTNNYNCGTNGIYVDWTTCTDKSYGPLGGYDMYMGVGGFFKNAGDIFVRGGDAGNTNTAGIYTLILNQSVSNSAPVIGFRCAYIKN